MRNDWVEVRSPEKKLDLVAELGIAGKWLVITIGLLVFGIVMLLGLGQVF